MKISPRDDLILRLLLRFGQLGSGHIRILAFYGLKSNTSCDNVLRRLVSVGLISRVERRAYGGWQGGSMPYVYQLALKGYRYLDRMDARRHYTTQRRHMLGIADTYVSMVKASRDGHIEIKLDLIEEEATTERDGVSIVPDLYVVAHVPARDQDIKLFIEVDMGSGSNRDAESPDKIESKLKRYYYLFNHWDEPTFPLVLFLAIDDIRVARLNHLISTRVPEKARRLFRVENMASFPQLLYELA